MLASKQFKIVILILFIVSIFTMSFCNGNQTIEITSNADDDGNMLFRNASGSELVLFVNGNPFRIIPNTLGDFIVYIPTDSRDTLIDMKIYKSADLGSNYSTDQAQAFKTWYRALNPTPKENPNLTWLVEKNDDGEDYGPTTNVGEITFQYLPGGNPYFTVLVFINGRNGEKVATMDSSPDNNIKTVGMPYGAYTVSYQYVYSNPNEGGEPEFFWLEEEIVGYDKVPIYVIMKEGRENPTKTIPWGEETVRIPAGEEPELANPYGFLSIYNDLSTPIDVYARSTELNIGNQNSKIENVMYDDGKTRDTASLIESDDFFRYTIHKGSWDIYIKDFAGNQIFYTKVKIESDKESIVRVTKNKPSFLEELDENEEEAILEEIPVDFQVMRWFIDSNVQGADVNWRVLSSHPDVIGTNNTYLGTTPYEATKSLSIDGLTYNNSSSVEIVITVSKEGYYDMVKGFNVQSLLSLSELSTKFDLVEVEEEEE